MSHTDSHLAAVRHSRLALLNPGQRGAAERMTENQLLAGVRARCKALGLLVYHTHLSTRSEPGYPDLTILGRKVLLRELKTEVGKVTADQDQWLTGLAVVGQDADVWRPADLLMGRIDRELRAIRLTP